MSLKFCICCSYFVILINACVARGGWVPRNVGAGAADP